MDKIEVIEEENLRIDKYLSENLDYSRSKVQNLLNKEKMMQLLDLQTCQQANQ